LDHRQHAEGGLDVYVSLVDDLAVYAIIKRPDGSTALIQIKAWSKEVVPGDGALFAAIPHDEIRANYWFIFYSERMDMMWNHDFGRVRPRGREEQRGKNVGLRSIWFNGKRTDKETGNVTEHCKPQWLKYVASNFDRIAVVPVSDEARI
jgi:hypothetical protein